MSVLTTNRNQMQTSDLLDFTQGIDVDSRLYDQEIRVQKAWLKGLTNAGFLSVQEAIQLKEALDAAHAAIAAGEFVFRKEDEDIHMNLERFVTDRLGDLGKKMHLGRSRNDLIATTLRLFVQDTLQAVRQGVSALGIALATLAEKFSDTIVPGQTHLQHGQPIRLGFFFASHAYAFARDLKNLDSAMQSAVETLPLGSAALSGSTLDMDWKELCAELGFMGPARNAYDAVGDRDFILQALECYSKIALHLSRLSEDVIFYSSSAVGLFKLPKAYSTGSSIMPNKRNPDVAELTRAKSAHVLGCESNAKLIVKALPTSYNSDLHEMKAVYLRSFDQLHSALSIFPKFILGLGVDTEKAHALIHHGHLLATEIADELARSGIPFRDAYQQVARCVEQADIQGVQVHELSLEDFKKLTPTLHGTFVQNLTFEGALEKRKGPGGTAQAALFRQIDELKKIFLR